MTPQRRIHLLFTTPLCQSPLRNHSVRNDKSASDLTLENSAGMRVAIVSGYADHDHVHPATIHNGIWTWCRRSDRLAQGLLRHGWMPCDQSWSSTYFMNKQGINHTCVWPAIRVMCTGWVRRSQRLAELAAILEKALNESHPERKPF